MPAAKGKDLNLFRSSHDRNVIVPAKIKACFAEMLKVSPENWDYEGEFTKRAGINQTDIGMFREQFEKHIVQLGGRNPKRVWFADPKVAARARGDL